MPHTQTPHHHYHGHRYSRISKKLPIRLLKPTDLLSSQISMCDNSIVWPGIKSLTHFSLWQLRRLYFPSHCGQEAVFIRASDAEIVSCLRSCQFQLVREQLSPIPRHRLVTLSPPSDWSPPPDPGLSLVESLHGLWSQSEPLAWIHNNLETDNTILCSLATSGETILVGPG